MCFRCIRIDVIWQVNISVLSRAKKWSELQKKSKLQHKDRNFLKKYKNLPETENFLSVFFSGFGSKIPTADSGNIEFSSFGLIRPIFFWYRKFYGAHFFSEYVIIFS